MKKRVLPFLITLGLLFSIETPAYSQGWTALNGGIPSTVNFITRYNGNIWVAADSVYYWNGTGWNAVGTGMLYPLGVGVVYALADFNGSLYAGGSFTVLTPDGNWYNNAGRLAGGSWTTCGSGTGNDGSGMNDYINFMTVYNGNLYAGGSFTSAGGDPLAPLDAMYIASFDGTQWNPVGSGMNDAITDMVVYNNQLVVSGRFTTAGGVSANHIASWDGTKWSSLGSGTNGKVTALAVFNGDLYAGGLFDTAGTVAATNIAKWDGQSWSALGDTLMGQVYTLAVWNNKLYAGGNNIQQFFFTTEPYVIDQNILCWDGSKWDSLGAGTNGPVYWLQPDSVGLLVGGSFTTAGNIAANNIAVYSTATAVHEPPAQPKQWLLSQNYPNPFNPSTAINYQLPSNGYVTLRVYDMLGREVATLVDGRQSAGMHTVKFDAAGLSSGVYLYRLTAGGLFLSRKMIFMK